MNPVSPASSTDVHSPAVVRLAVIVVGYNTRDLLRDCLACVFRTRQPADWDLQIQVVVVDNASRDGSAAMVAAEFPQVTLLAQTENLGFTRANNLALEWLGFPCAYPDEVRGESSLPHMVLLLNADTRVEPDALTLMADFLRHHPTAGACGAHLSYGDGTFQHGAFRFPTLAQVILDLWPVYRLPAGHRLYQGWLNGRYGGDAWAGDRAFPVDFTLGAALMVRRETVLAVGGLDEGFFMYCEEMDWCLRMWKAQWPVYALPQAHIVHLEGQSSRQTPWRSFVELWRSRLRFFTKHGQRYPLGFMILLRRVLAFYLRGQRRHIRRQFGRGEIDGLAAEQALAAYGEIGQMLSASRAR